MLLSNFNLLATAPGGVTRLRELILTLAVQGKLVPQDPTDEPAEKLLQKILVEKNQLVAAGKIKRDKPLAAITEEEHPFKLPVGWKWVRLGQLANFIDYRGKTPTKTESGVPLITAKNVRQGFINRLPREFIAETAYAGWMTRGFPKVGDLLFTTEAPLGNVAAIDIEENFALAQRVICFGLYEPQMSGALSTFLRSPRMQRMFSDQATGVTAQGIKSARLRVIPIPIPPLAEQSRIVTRVEELMHVCDALEVKGKLEAAQHAQLVSTLLGTLAGSDTPDALAQNWQRIAAHFDQLLDRPQAIDAFEKTILQLAVRGLLVPQDPKDEPASVLLQKIRAEKDCLILEGKIKRDKPLQPIAEEEKPFEVSAGWEWVRLGTASKKITDGTHHSPANFPSGDFMYLSAKNIKPWGIDLSSATFVPKAVHDEIYARCDPEFGDILYIKDGATTGVLTVNSIREPFSLLSSVGVIKPSCGLTSEFMALVMQSPFFYQAIRDGMAGVAITRVTLSKLCDAKFPLPPLAEQSRIVARVEELRCLCANLRQRLSASQTTQAHLAEALVESVVG